MGIGILLFVIGILALVGETFSFIPLIGPIFVNITRIIRYRGPASVGLIIIGAVLMAFGY
jgi:hypothetical protein